MRVVFALLVLVPLVKKRHEAPGLRGRDVWVLMRGSAGGAIPPPRDEAADIGAMEVLKRVMARCAREEREEREARCVSGRAYRLCRALLSRAVVVVVFFFVLVVVEL